MYMSNEDRRREFISLLELNLPVASLSWPIVGNCPAVDKIESLDAVLIAIMILLLDCTLVRRSSIAVITCSVETIV